MFMGGTSHNAVARHFDVHRTLVLCLVRLTCHRQYSGRTRVLTPNQDRKIIRPTHIQDFILLSKSGIQTHSHFYLYIQYR